MTIRQMRTEKGLTQKRCAEYLDIPLRTYVRYETSGDALDSKKYEFIVGRLSGYGRIDEEHGILTIEQIKQVCNEVLAAYPVEFCYLFGSYAKGKATEKSDVDLLISMPVNGLMFYELVEELREKLKKKVDLLDVTQLKTNIELTKDILKDGIKVFG